ncbi:hypothetical protein D1007_37995 [Hordeum vulgare]|nr:hypothetical protein D1007_37995 [Hordeum vulgare]
MSSPAHRNRPQAITADTSSYQSAWARLLHPDIVRLVGWQLLDSDLLDYVRFRATCRRWTSCTVSPRGSGIVEQRFYPRQWMLLPQDHGLHPGNGVLRFFNLSRGIFVRTRLPLLTDHRVLDSADGVLLLQHHRDDDVPIRVLNPLTGDAAELPPRMPPFVRVYFDSHTIKDQEHAASLSVSADGIATVVVALFGLSTTIIFATTRDRRWSVTAWSSRYMGVPSVSFQGKIYALRSSTEWGTSKRIVQIYQIDPSMLRIGLSYPKLIASCSIGEIDDSFDLVECDSEILLIHTKYSATSPQFVVYRLADLSLDKVIPMTSIRGNVLFLDVARRQSVSSREVHGITGVQRRNDIYRSDEMDTWGKA